MGSTKICVGGFPLKIPEPSRLASRKRYGIPADPLKNCPIKCPLLIKSALFSPFALCRSNILHSRKSSKNSYLSPRCSVLVHSKCVRPPYMWSRHMSWISRPQMVFEYQCDSPCDTVLAFFVQLQPPIHTPVPTVQFTLYVIAERSQNVIFHLVLAGRYLSPDF